MYDQLKSKYSIFSPPHKQQEMQSQIAFKKSPMKVYLIQQIEKHKQPQHKTNSSQTSSLYEKDLTKKNTLQSGNLRQTMNYKPSTLKQFLTDERQKQKNITKSNKDNNFLRHTITLNTPFRSKNDKSFSDNNSIQETYQKFPESSSYSSYSRSSLAYLGESKSSVNLYESSKSDKYSSPIDNYKSTKNINIINSSKKQSANNREEQELSRNPIKVRGIQRKFSYQSYQFEKQIDISSFKKKKQENNHEPYTPKPLKYTYQDRFKKTGSPTSTNNSQNLQSEKIITETPDRKKVATSNKFIGIEEFNIGKKLGEGKFGTVFIAKHKKTQSLFAIKKIPKQMIKSHFMIDQLALELRLQMCLNHKNVLGMYGFFDDSTHLYIVLEYMEQGTLYSKLKKCNILKEPQAAAIIKQITAAIQYLHNLNIAHRDIKPQNIVMSNNVCKLCDFGWATICNERRKTYCGTFDYAAPQILEGAQYDMAVDLWCLGVMTYQLLAGKAPFYHISRKETMKRILNVQTEAIIYPETMSKQAIDFIDKLIKKDPNERIEAAKALKHPFLKNVDDV